MIVNDMIPVVMCPYCSEIINLQGFGIKAENVSIKCSNCEHETNIIFNRELYLIATHLAYMKIILKEIKIKDDTASFILVMNESEVHRSILDIIKIISNNIKSWNIEIDGNTIKFSINHEAIPTVNIFYEIRGICAIIGLYHKITHENGLISDMLITDMCEKSLQNNVQNNPLYRYNFNPYPFPFNQGWRPKWP